MPHSTYKREHLGTAVLDGLGEKVEGGTICSLIINMVEMIDSFNGSSLVNTSRDTQQKGGQMEIKHGRVRFTFGF